MTYATADAALVSFKPSLPSPPVPQQQHPALRYPKAHAPLPMSPAEQYWAARALTAETLLSAAEAHQREVRSAVDAEEEKRLRDITVLQKAHSERERKMERVVMFSGVFIALLVAVLVYLLVDHHHARPKGPAPSMWGVALPSHFTIPILSPWTSVVEHEASVIGAKTTIAFALIAAGLAYAMFRYWAAARGHRQQQ